MKVIMFKVCNCKECPAGSLRTTNWPKSEPVCTLFMDEHELGRRGRVMDIGTYNTGIPGWCPLDDIVEDVDADGNKVYVIKANQQNDDPGFEYSKLHDDVVKWRDVI